MCQYACEDRDGMPGDWHLVHLGARAAGGFGLVMTEASAVEPEGRTTPWDCGIWSDQQAERWADVVRFGKAQGTVMGIQLAHAGRKGSTHRPFGDGSGAVDPDAGGWATVAPSDNAYPGLPAPEALGVDDIGRVVESFRQAAVRAVQAGFDVIELHAAHGYLLHQFLSPLVNRRTDAYGGGFDGRIRFVLEVVRAVRSALPDTTPLFLRVSATDWVAGGWDVDQSAELADRAGAEGVDLIDVSSGGAVPEQRIDAQPKFQVPFATTIAKQSGLPVAAVGLITTPGMADEIVRGGEADAVMLARVGLREPSWPLRAAHELGINPREAPYPVPYRRGAWR